MGNRTNYPSQSGGQIGQVEAKFKLKLNGASAPTVLAGNSYLSPTSPPTHAGGTNIVSVTMRDPWLEVVGHAVDVRDDTPNGAYATLGTFANESSTTVPPSPITFKLNTWTAGGAAANDSSLVVTVTITLRNSTVTYGNTP